MSRIRNSETRPEDCATAWFAVLERARLDGDVRREKIAQQELKRLGVDVQFREPAMAGGGAR